MRPTKFVDGVIDMSKDTLQIFRDRNAEANINQMKEQIQSQKNFSFSSALKTIKQNSPPPTTALTKLAFLNKFVSSYSRKFPLAEKKLFDGSQDPSTIISLDFEQYQECRKSFDYSYSLKRNYQNMSRSLGHKNLRRFGEGFDQQLEDEFNLLISKKQLKKSSDPLQLSSMMASSQSVHHRSKSLYRKSGMKH
jgi:hypothetical protein